ncbi:hypothetical protein OIU77_010301 [Salix suchowensis]|uniref:Uncharacterized protein n=1 Tax=Salix suchowensis TaxID=1278906 RepID=A0ABQ9A7U1_9ROSI|nr:hypothetical protein OIU77_010301 [Salix suchowensis]
MVEVKEINSNSKTKGLVYWTGLVPHSGIRNAIQNQQGRITGPARRSSKWTGDEDKILADAVKRYNSRNWKKIAECVPDRTDVQCLHRWQKVLDPKLVKGPWKKEEDDLIRELVETHGNKKWSQIAKHLPGRIGKQCRERYLNTFHFAEILIELHGPKEEEAILIKAHGAYGNKWAEIAKLLHGRTENSIKNHWNCSVRKRIESYPARGLDLYSYRAEADGKKLEVGKQRNDQGHELVLICGTLFTGFGSWKCWSKGGPIAKIAEKVLVVHTHLSQPTIPPLISLEISAIFLSGGLMRSPNSQERTHETANTVDSLPSVALSPSLDLSLSTPFSTRGYDETMDEHEKNIGAGGPNTSDKLHHGLCYESLQLKDLNVFPGNRPESRLRSKARSFKSTPSIIRKRSSVTLRQAGSSDKDDNGLRSLGSCSSDKDGDDDVDLLNKKKLFLSPPKSKKLETSEGMKSVEKRLEYAFNI